MEHHIFQALSIGTEVPDVGCQWHFDAEEDVGTERYLTYCDKRPTIKSEYLALLCPDHLQANREITKKYNEQFALGPRILVNIKSHAFGNFEGVAYRISQNKEPRFGGHFGRTWDTLARTERDERVVVDSTWGRNGYFRRNCVLYRVNMIEASDQEKRILQRLKNGRLLTMARMRCPCGRKATYICMGCGCLCCGEDPCIYNCGGSVQELDKSSVKQLRDRGIKVGMSERPQEVVA